MTNTAVRLAFSLALFGASLSVACAPTPTGDVSPEDAATPEPAVHPISPVDTDPTIVDDGQDTHYAFWPGSEGRGVLVLHMGGSGSLPKGSLLYPTILAAAGFHAINLRYPNDSIGALCASDADEECANLIRTEVADGTDDSVHVVVSPASSIVGRLRSLLSFLAETEPDEGWSAFLEDGEPKWSSIVVSGHSLGGGYSAFFGHRQEVAGVVQFSAPAAVHDDGTPAYWLVPPFATPIDRFASFVSTADPSYDVFTAVWLAMGVADANTPTNVDIAVPPFTGAQCLLTSHAVSLPATAHGSTVTDSSTPLNSDGTPLFAPVWLHMVEATTAR